MAKGYITRRGASWLARVDAGRKPDGSRNQVAKTFRTRKDAERWSAETRVKLDKGEFVQPSRQTYGAFLAAWLPTRKTRVRASTWESYERNIRLHLVPRLGHIPLQQLGPEHLNTAYGELERDGLSRRTVAYLRVIVHRSLRDAVRWGKVTRNVAKDTDPLDIPKRKPTVWNGEQLRAFLDSLTGDRLHVPVLLAATTGLRRGELLGLRWSDVDLDAGSLTVQQTLIAPRDPATGKHTPMISTPKTDAGIRSIDLGPEAVAALRAHRKTQNELRLMGVRNDLDLVFIDDEHGTPVHPTRFAVRFDWRVKQSGLPRVRFHDLRHTHATLLLQAGTPVKVVSQRLGHANIGTTLDIYAHVLPGQDRAAAETGEAAIFGVRAQNVHTGP